MIDRFKDDYEFLSNFADSPFTYEGRKFPTVEHAYQAYKSLDPAIFKAIAEAKTPGDAKRAGRSVVNLRPDWDCYKLWLMYKLVQAKFAQNDGLAYKLLNTNDEMLVEGNTWGDRFWGQVDGQGENMLGKVLMIVRQDLRPDPKLLTRSGSGGRVSDRIYFMYPETITAAQAKWLQYKAGYHPGGYGFNSFSGKTWNCAGNCD